jgi:hypothetical protein
MADNEDNNLQPQGGLGIPHPQLLSLIELKTIFSNPNGSITKDSITAKFMYN